MLTDADLVQIQQEGRSLDAVRSALDTLARPVRYVRLLRPATPGDGILASDVDLRPLAERAARQGRITSFIPASGASTRLAASLDAEALARYPHIAAALEGLDPSRLPKALVPVHDYPDGARTPLEEHLREAGLLAADGTGRIRMHFTVGEADLARFEQAVAEIAARLGLDVDVAFSVQAASTDMPFVHQGQPVRDAQGRLRFRPGGHGALFANLSAVDGDVVLVKNIDNVVVDGARGVVLDARKQLIGTLVAARDALRDARAVGPDAVRSWFRDHTGEQVDDVDAALARPLRVCGMVRNTGAPGGGPFWTEAGLQIVEGVEIDRADPGQAAILAASTHFNPVELALCLRDLDGGRIDLAPYVDATRVLRATKQVGGRSVDVIEHPGLWNGSMAGWTTLFLAMPAAIFAPIKTVADLATPAHDPEAW